MQIRPYLTFKGECQEAIDIYCKAFNTKVSQIMRFSDIPPNPNSDFSIPQEQKDWVLQATLELGDNFIRMSDCTGELNNKETETIAIAVECSTEEVKRAFEVLSEEGRVGVALQETFFSPCHGVVFDKFGIMWNFVAKAEE